MLKIKNFLYSTYFTALIYLFTVFCWYFKVQTVSIVVSIILGIFIVLTNSNRIIIVTIMFSSIINYRNATFEANKYYIIIACIVFAPILFYDLFKSKINYKDGIFVALMFFILANILSFINVNQDKLSYAIVGLIAAVTFAFVYLYFNTKIKTSEQIYVAKSSMFLGLAIALEFLIYALTFEGPMEKDINLGWGISNYIATLYYLIIPFTIYLYLKRQKFLYMIALIVHLLVVFLMFSKGAYLTIAVIAIPFIIYTFKKIDNKKKVLNDILYTVLIFLLIGTVAFIIDKQRIIQYFSIMGDRGWFNDEIRLKIFTIGINVFIDHPLFGAGAYTGGYYLRFDGLIIMNYHNIYIQSLATLGVFGFIAFIYFIYCSIRKCLGKKDLFNIYLIFSIVALLIHGLVDTTWYNPIIFILMGVFLSIRSKEDEVICDKLN